MTLNHHELQDLTIKGFEKLINKRVKIGLIKPKKPKGFEKEQSEFIGIIKGIGLSANSPHIPVDINEKINRIINNRNLKEHSCFIGAKTISFK
jgi:hypothetical protein